MPTGQNLPILPHEIIIEILSWIPVKYLMHFRCVCKTWNSLIFDSTLVKLHLERSSKNTHTILTQEDVPDPADSYDVNAYAIPCSINRLFNNPSSAIDEDICYQLKTKYWVTGSCNGLVCLRGCYIGHEFDEYWVRFWNPATRKRSKKSPCLCVNPCCRRFGAATSVNFGFGYDDSSDIYKVVFLLLDCRSEKTEVRVHDLGENYWRNILTFPTFPILEQNGHFLSGTINWLALDKLSSHFDCDNIPSNELVIFSFDLRKEKHRYLLLPDGLDEVFEVKPNLVVLRDSLWFFHYDRGTHFIAWQMREFGDDKCWTQLVKVSYENLQSESFLRPMLLLCMSENGDVLLLVNNDDLEVIIYNQRNDMVSITEIPNDKVWWQTNEYFPSLVSPYKN